MAHQNPRDLYDSPRTYVRMQSCYVNSFAPFQNHLKNCLFSWMWVCVAFHSGENVHKVFSLFDLSPISVLRCTKYSLY